MTTAPPSPRAGMRARARLHTQLDPHAPVRRTKLAVLRSQSPLTLRPTIHTHTGRWGELVEGAARVCLAAGAAGPVGGDELALDIEVGAGSTLVLTEASATLVLPGPDGARSRTQVRVQVREGGQFVWLPEPVIAARGCDHVNDITVELAADARLLMRDELLLGRRGEPSGRLLQSVRVRRGGHALHAQDLYLGEDYSHSPAVAGAHRAVGSLLVVDPALPERPAELLDEDGTLLPLAGGGAVLAQALSTDSLGLRRQLDAAYSRFQEAP